ncbi:MAG: hypothetical protein U0841_08865 [Chloroflexia bacterium]
MTGSPRVPFAASCLPTIITPPSRSNTAVCWLRPIGNGAIARQVSVAGS